MIDGEVGQNGIEAVPPAARSGRVPPCPARNTDLPHLGGSYYGPGIGADEHWMGQVEGVDRLATKCGVQGSPSRTHCRIDRARSRPGQQRSTRTPS
ncbi:MAG: hypothetical protein AcusKO_43170 [Acuticoccus sp.]